jgi:GDPmannose 4,6-dehydratase
MPKIIITGVTGMVGSLMADYLTSDITGENEVYGMARPSASPNHENLEVAGSRGNFELVSGDLTDEVSINSLVKRIQPDFFLNFAAHSFVGDSWNYPMHVLDTNTGGVIRCLEAIRHFAPECKFHNSGTSEEFGNVSYSPQDELHPLKPRSPYGASKASARQYVKIYRESYDMFAIQSWGFNHEGPRRAEQFVTRKITKWAARTITDIRGGSEPKPLELGNLEVIRDWSDARDFVRAVWSMMTQDTPAEYVMASGECHSVKDFLERAMNVARIPFRRKEIDTENFDDTGKILAYTYDHMNGVQVPLVYISKKFFRPADVDLLHGDSSKLRKELGWEPYVTFPSLVEEMVYHDMDLIWRNER